MCVDDLDSVVVALVAILDAAIIAVGLTLASCASIVNGVVVLVFSTTINAVVIVASNGKVAVQIDTFKTWALGSTVNSLLECSMLSMVE